MDDAGPADGPTGDTTDSAHDAEGPAADGTNGADDPTAFEPAGRLSAADRARAAELAARERRIDARRLGPGPYLRGLRRDDERWGDGFPFALPVIAGADRLELDNP